MHAWSPYIKQDDSKQVIKINQHYIKALNKLTSWSIDDGQYIKHKVIENKS